ncbi:MAG: hypothetical protein KAT58_00875 [candidate division Zixibacteria bacterium]|nr:hypothetical protein [candidate division Zixibacteria bacterium]
MTPRCLALLTTVTAVLAVNTVTAVELKQSLFDREQNRIKYLSAFQAIEENTTPNDPEDLSGFITGGDKPEVKSPGRAFFYSLAVPGLGQRYYGSKIKPFVFFSFEITAWVLYFKWHGQGEDLTRDYEDFNQEHWLPANYERQLRWTYKDQLLEYHELDSLADIDSAGIVGNDDIIKSTEITHHLPDEMNQQYYEMTGKYDQFAWGWDDATLGGKPLGTEDDTLGKFYQYDPPPTTLHADSVPVSANRTTYEGMRHTANKRFDKARRMIFASLANRLISAFEAFFMVKRQNNKIKHETWDISRLNVKPRLKSVYNFGDTPFVTFSYKF